MNIHEMQDGGKKTLQTFFVYPNENREEIFWRKLNLKIQFFRILFVKKPCHDHKTYKIPRIKEGGRKNKHLFEEFKSHVQVQYQINLENVSRVWVGKNEEWKLEGETFLTYRESLVWCKGSTLNVGFLLTT